MLKKREVFSHPGLKRLNYYNGQLLTADDFKAEQDYHRRMHCQYNRAAFGYGIVRGLNVSCSEHRVSVTPGFAVDRFGRLLELPEACNFDLLADEGLWDLVIELVEELCDPQPTALQGNNADDGKSFSRIQEVVKVCIIEVSDKDKEKSASAGVLLGTIQSCKGQCQLKNKRPKKGNQTTYQFLRSDA